MPSPTIPATSTLRSIRDLIPKRRIQRHEHRRLAELQANRLRSNLHVTDNELHSDVIASLPSINVRYEQRVPVSGLSFWNGTSWVIVLNQDEPETRQRFTLLHELQHIISHPTTTRLFGQASGYSAAAEQMADHFAACALMPKRHVKRLFGEGHRQPDDLASHFGVSTAAMSIRLQHLGLTDVDAPRRCSRTRAPRSNRATGHAS